MPIDTMRILVERMILCGRSLAIFGALGVSGCATGNPGLDAAGNFVGSLLVAEAGRSQVVVNQAPGVQVNQGSNMPTDTAKGPWAVFTAGYCDDYSVRSARDIRDTFAEGETFYVMGKGPSTSYVRFEVSNDQGKQVVERVYDHRQKPGTVQNGGFVRIAGGTVPAGTYTVKVFDGSGLNSKGSFKIIPR
jgi:hypothetical protein